MATEGLRKHSTTLFTGVLSGQQPHWSGLLPNHTNLTNHQLVMTASETIADGEGKYAVYIIPDTEGVTQAVDTGLVLDLSNKDSAIVNFTGVIRGLYLQATDIIVDAGIRISAVLSSFSRYKTSGVTEGDEDRLNYVSTESRELVTGSTNYSVSLPNHSNMIYHQLSLMADGPIDDQYLLRIIPESERPLETSVDTGKVLEFAETASCLLYFGGVISGITLERLDGTSSGVHVRVVVSSSTERHDEIVYQYIGVPDTGGTEIGDHLTDYDNPHEVTYEQILGEKPELGFPVVNTVLVGGEERTIPLNHQLLVWEQFSVQGELTISPGGELIVLHDRPETTARNPDFTYNLDGQLTEINYVTGEQKLFTYSSGQLIQLDSLRDGTTLKKSFVYTVGGQLDYITQQWI